MPPLAAGAGLGAALDLRLALRVGFSPSSRCRKRNYAGVGSSDAVLGKQLTDGAKRSALFAQRSDIALHGQQP